MAASLSQRQRRDAHRRRDPRQPIVIGSSPSPSIWLARLQGGTAPSRGWLATGLFAGWSADPAIPLAEACAGEGFRRESGVEAQPTRFEGGDLALPTGQGGWRADLLRGAAGGVPNGRTGRRPR